MCFSKTSSWLLQKGRGIASSQLHSWNGAGSYAAYCHQEALGISHMNCTPCSQVCCELCRPGRSDRMSSVLLTFLSSLGTGQRVWIWGEMSKALKNSGLSCVLFVWLFYICYSRLDDLCLDLYFHSQAVEEKNLEPLDSKKCHLLWQVLKPMRMRILIYLDLCPVPCRCVICNLSQWYKCDSSKWQF